MPDCSFHQLRQPDESLERSLETKRNMKKIKFRNNVSREYENYERKYMEYVIKEETEIYKKTLNQIENFLNEQNKQPGNIMEILLNKM